MKKFVYYTIIMFVITILLPCLIVRGCSSDEDDYGDSDSPKSGYTINIYIPSENEVKKVDFEEYIKGVVAAEMPAEFDLEALKAQAVAARTYALGRMNGTYKPKEDKHEGADVCTEAAHCQAWVSKETAKKRWGIFSSYKYWNKISKAVEQTKGEVITYYNTTTGKDELTNPVFHSNSGDKTENAEEVWGTKPVPYLRSVESPGEDTNGEYKTTVTYAVEDFREKFLSKYPDAELDEEDFMKNIKIIDHTEGGRVKNIKIGNIGLKGTDFRSIFSLRSANFSIEMEGKDQINITTIGNGHGVGMSQWGANYLAKNGKEYDEILKHYYQGVELDSMDSYLAKD